MTTDFNGITDIKQVFLPSRKFRRQMRNTRCTLCDLGVISADLALMEVELGGVRTDTRIIHKQCSALIWDLLDELRGVDGPAADPSPGVEGPVEAG